MKNSTASWTLGHSAGLGAFSIWGAFPLYWAIFSHLNALSVALYRFIFTAITLAFIITFSKKWKILYKAMGSKKLFSKLVFASLCITANWFIFIWAVAHELTWQSSLGYYISPLVTVALGTLLLKEKLLFSTKLSLGLACTGISLFLYQTGNLPLVSLSLAITFSIYGYIKKNIPLAPHLSLAFEVFATLPVCLVTLYFTSNSNSSFAPLDWVALSFSGILTVIPMFLYNYSAQRIPLNNLGMLQFVSPTLQFLTAQFIFHENIGGYKLMAFTFIWLAILNYLFGPFIWNRFRVKNG